MNSSALEVRKTGFALAWDVCTSCGVLLITLMSSIAVQRRLGIRSLSSDSALGLVGAKLVFLVW